MITVTRQQLREGARRYADMRNSNQFLLDTDINALIDQAAAEYWDLLISVRGQDTLLSSDTISIAAGTSEYVLPDDFYQLSTVTLEWGTDEHEIVLPIHSNKELATFANHFNNWERFTAKGFRTYGTQEGDQTIAFFPTPTTAVTARLRYVPHYTAFTADTGDGGTMAAENHWAKLVMLKVAMEIRTIADLPTGNLEKLLTAQHARVLEMANERLQDDPAEVVDVEIGMHGRWYPYPRFNSG